MNVNDCDEFKTINIGIAVQLGTKFRIYQYILVNEKKINDIN